jgi:hypothetical protein
VTQGNFSAKFAAGSVYVQDAIGYMQLDGTEHITKQPQRKDCVQGLAETDRARVANRLRPSPYTPLVIEPQETDCTEQITKRPRRRDCAQGLSELIELE